MIRSNAGENDYMAHVSWHFNKYETWEWNRNASYTNATCL